MRREHLKLALQIFGAATGVMGVMGSILGLGLIYASTLISFSVVGILFGLAQAAIGAYLIWLGYTAVRNFGPRIVLHLSGALTVFVISIPASYFREPQTLPFWLNLLCFLSILLLAANYRKLATRLNQHLFREDAPRISGESFPIG